MKKVLPVLLLLAIGALLGVAGHRRFLARERAAHLGALRLYGNVELRDAQLAFPDRERLATVDVEEGDRLAPRQLVATLRTERLDAAIAAAEARLAAQQAVVDRLEHGTRAQELAQVRERVAAAEVDVANATRDLDRLRKTTESGASSAQALDAADARVQVAEAALRVERASLALAEEGPRSEDREQARATLGALRAELAALRSQRADAELRAPYAGVVRSRILEPGEMAGPDRPVVTLARTDPKWVRAWLPEPDLGRVALGMAATVRSDSFGGRRYAGRVGFVSPVAEFTPQSVETEDLRTQLVYEVRVLVDDPHDELRLGMPVTVDLEAGAATAPEPGDGR
ncbi:MAG: HlyD family efflux transporter periplasmic adaptor subunit [Planctomycetes bacterium]|nr:HlyD family efflux transporter periplasmic adaptor subunit [Planctomycetota bacterium]